MDLAIDGRHLGEAPITLTSDTFEGCFSLLIYIVEEKILIDINRLLC
ncbi:hypothetical protein [Clostridium tagluense]|nr:hypothetical protein [Clostridium tagluense]MBU3126266.1 hypothetical protein [Clostridium tagluense]